LEGNICSRCGASLTNGYCEYCGWNSPTPIEDKTITLSGILCDLTVTKESSTFKQKVGTAFQITNNEISQISLTQAPVVGSGELTLRTVTGITQNITFLYPQNQNMNEIASYLLKVAPGAQFVNTTPISPQAAFQGIMCPKCRSNNTTISGGETRCFTVWKIVLGGFLAAAGLGSFREGIGVALLLITGGIVLVINGLGIIGKKKMNCLCGNCRRRFRV